MGKLPQYGIPYNMPVCVVYAFEVIDIDEKQ